MATTKKAKNTAQKVNTTEILKDYQVAWESRHASLMGRKEVFMGKAKFGIFGDGKELAQIAMAKAFKAGDFRSGYYRDQTFMFAIGQLTIQAYFAQLYAHTDVEADPSSAGRSMNGHFSTRMLDKAGHYVNLTETKNSSSDVSPTAAQMPRLLGLAFASKLFRQNKALHAEEFQKYSISGNEVAFGTIGNASTSEGMFYETINAGGVLQVPMLVSVWDDGFGISVPQEYHTTKGNISDALSGFQRTKEQAGYEIIKVKGWEYQELVAAYQKAAKISREEHVPTLVHVNELTQPQGHSTSGSHERYKSKERLAWEVDYDCIVKFKEYILANHIAEEATLDEIETQAKKTAKQAKDAAWKAFIDEIKTEQKVIVSLLQAFQEEASHPDAIEAIIKDLKSEMNPLKLHNVKATRKALRYDRGADLKSRNELKEWLKDTMKINEGHFSSHLYSESDLATNKVAIVPVEYGADAEKVDGREVLQACFDAALTNNPKVFAFGEDVGKIGDVNQAFAGLQDKHGELRVMDTGIRECTILGQGIGAALRGLRPIAEIQYLDYLLYAIQIMSDDLACLQYRTKGGQKAPLIIRTRGHRLEGVWHSGSPMGMILNSIRGINVLVPRNMTQAAGFYNTMLRSDEPALIIECLNGYRLKETMPSNVGEFTVPLGQPEVIREGEDITVVTYGSMCRVVNEAANQLAEMGISVEIIDVQTLLPFDVDHKIVESIKKTNKVVFADEDVPGGGSAFMMQKVLEEQHAFRYLDAQPITISAKEHRPAYGSDGDYFSKPNPEGIFEKLYNMMHEYAPDNFPGL